MNPKSIMVNSWKLTNNNNARHLTAADIADNINLLNNVLVGVGLIRLTNIQFTGQGGIAVTTTPNTGESQVPTPSNDQSLFFYAYKHPVLDIYFRVAFKVSHHPSQNATQMKLEITPFTTIKNGVISGQSYSYTSFDINTTAIYYTYSLGKTGDANLYAYCDDNGFWVAIAPMFPVGSIATTANGMVANVSILSFLFQRDLESKKTIFMNGQFAMYNGSGSQIVGYDTRGTQGILSSMPCTWVMANSDGLISRTDASNMPFTTLPQPNIANKNGAVRVFAAETYWSDESVSTWNFGTINNGAMSDGAIGLIDMLGTGSPREYIAIKGFGPVVPTVGCAPAFYKPDAHLQMLLPWVT